MPGDDNGASGSSCGSSDDNVMTRLFPKRFDDVDDVDDGVALLRLLLRRALTIHP